MTHDSCHVLQRQSLNWWKWSWSRQQAGRQGVEEQNKKCKTCIILLLLPLLSACICDMCTWILFHLLCVFPFAISLFFLFILHIPFHFSCFYFWNAIQILQKATTWVFSKTHYHNIMYQHISHKCNGIKTITSLLKMLENLQTKSVQEIQPKKN